VHYGTQQGAEIGLAQASCVFQNGSKNPLQIARRYTDEAQYLRCGGLLLVRLVQLARLTLKLPLQLGNRRTGSARGLGRGAALRLCCGALRFGCFVACFGAPLHWLTRGLGGTIVAGQTSVSEVRFPRRTIVTSLTM
jgi:hypothetical protein